MAIEITSVADEAAYNKYIAARNAPRDTIKFGVVPNATKCLAEYDALTSALAGDMSAYADYHASTVARVAPFIALMYKAMELLVATPLLINAAAEGAGEYPPFAGIEGTPLDGAAYATLLTETGAAIAAVGQALGGGG